MAMAENSTGWCEERWNAVTHAAGFLVALVALPVLVVQCAIHGGAAHIVGGTIFGISMLAALGASALYHSASDPDRRRTLRILDHAAIYLLIAGSYTPICLTSLQGGWGWSLFGVVWGCALVGIVLKIRFTGRFDLLSTLIYLAMGWLCLVAIVPMFQRLQSESLVFLFVAGFSFTSGVVFYLGDNRRGFHLAWHLFVLNGCLFLYLAVFSELWA
ncbi:MAG: hemolysin III family protein [Phycisphaerales bacterium]|nr:hemolysin III family protein [Phycisphaerales bacterium]